MVQSDGRRGIGTLQRVALEIKGTAPLTMKNGKTLSSNMYRFKVNPQQYKHSKPQRVSVLKTKSDIVVEDFGTDLETITFSGTTGFKRDSSGKTGEQKLRELEEFIEYYANLGGDGNVSPNELVFHNFTENLSYVVHLDKSGLELSRDVETPILFNYALHLVVLRSASTPSERETVDPELGNIQSRVVGSNSTKAINPNNETSKQQVQSGATKAVKSLLGYI